jgi:AraC family transcriptional regulator of adaptative response/methylated-DNA-[protein]-cysteine methyltransferase
MEMTNYQRIEKAIIYLNNHFREQPDLDTIAESVFLSPFHFNRLFKEWAGVTPKKFLQYISLQHAKKLLDNNHTLAHASYETGLSGTSRLHDLFVSIEGMTPGEYKNGGAALTLSYSFSETPFGKIIIASSGKGICRISFAEDEEIALTELKTKWNGALLQEKKDYQHEQVLKFFHNDWSDASTIKLHLKGTEFQLKVWEALLKIPAGGLSTYASIASSISLPKACRAVGSAIGDNPVAFLIPCHRVIKSTGIIGDYHWGSTRKKALIGWESSNVFGETD